MAWDAKTTYQTLAPGGGITLPGDSRRRSILIHAGNTNGLRVAFGGYVDVNNEMLTISGTDLVLLHVDDFGELIQGEITIGDAGFGSFMHVVENLCLG